MLGPWRTHGQFQEQLEKPLGGLMPQNEKQIMFHAGAIEKVYIMNLDLLKELVISCDSSTGRPALNQPEIFRAVVLANHYKEPISSFAARLKADGILAIACGFETDNLPGVGSFYDFFTDSGWSMRRPKLCEILKTVAQNQDFPQRDFL